MRHRTFLRGVCTRRFLGAVSCLHSLVRDLSYSIQALIPSAYCPAFVDEIFTGDSCLIAILFCTSQLKIPYRLCSINLSFLNFLNLFLHESQSLTMHYFRDERGDEALTLCRPMGLGFPVVRTRQEGKEKRYERQ